MDDYTPAYDTLQNEADNVEIIRDQTAALLALDFDKQLNLALEARDPAADDYNVAVFIEKDNPIQFVDIDDEIVSVINVSLDSAKQASRTTSVNRQKMTATLLIDVYAGGNYYSTEDKGRKASLKAWKIARLVRRILRAEPNTYLRLRGVVGQVSLDFQSGEPADVHSAIRVKMVRVTATVEYTEGVEITTGPEIEVISMTIDDQTGLVSV